MSISSTLLLDDRQQRIADWGATIEPAVYQDSSLYPFPLPIRILRIRDAWDFEKHHVPLCDGDEIVGQSQRGVEILIDGQFATQNGETTRTAAEMIAEIEALRSVLNAASTDGKYSLFLIHDSSTPYYRKFKDCSTVKLEFDLSNGELFAYSAVIQSEDPVLYATAPGS